MFTYVYNIYYRVLFDTSLKFIEDCISKFGLKFDINISVYNNIYKHAVGTHVCISHVVFSVSFHTLMFV